MVALRPLYVVVMHVTMQDTMHYIPMQDTMHYMTTQDQGEV